jgi:hypothetical protein
MLHSYLRSLAVLVAGLLPVPTLGAVPDDWQFAASVYGWFPDICGKTAVAIGGSDSIDVDVDSILDHLEMTAQGSF